MVEPRQAEAMAAALAHRGPDGAGSFAWPAEAPRVALAMRRLAVLDLETGDQPVFSEDGQIAVVCNGELYNYVELRAELAARGHCFRSRGDTEVLAHLYEERGVDLFASLRGMYAFALWDAARARLVLAVDHLGIKPLYVHTAAGRLRFASEIKGLLADPQVPRRVRTEAIETFLRFGYPIGEQTLLDGIERLPPGSALVVERGRVTRLRHWRPRLQGPAEHRGEAAPALGVRDCLRDAVRVHMRSDVPLGLFLSGGIDSTGLLALMRREAGPVRTFTVGYDGGPPTPHDETAQAAQVARWAGSVHRELRLSPREWWTTLERYIGSHDEPNANASMVALLALAREAAREVRVVLNGTGGDELFGGYPAHLRFPRVMRRHARLSARYPAWLRARVAAALSIGERWYPALRRWPLAARAPAAIAGRRAAWLPGDEGLRRLASFEALVLTDHLRGQLLRPELQAIQPRARHAETTYRTLLADAQLAASDPAGVAQALVMRTWLPGNGLLALDTVTMAHGLEARVPYFDRALMERVFGLNPESRLRRGKALLVAALSPDLPPPFLRRAKRPFETPLQRWLDRDLAGELRSVLLDPGARIRELVRTPVVERMLARQATRRAEHSELLLRLVMLELWWRRVLAP